jgi:hypothetical protein
MKREIFIPIFIIVLMIIFVIISAIVFFSKGKSSFVKQKLKIGAIIISISAFASCNIHKHTCYKTSVDKKNDIKDSSNINDNNKNNYPPPTCYSPPPPKK